METRVLNYFLMVAKTGNVTKAAENLHITQPTLSRQMVDLEDELGIKLFDRSNRRLDLTHAGVLFQERARMILNLIDQTENELNEQGDELSGTIHLGCVESSASIFIMQMVKKMQEKYPQVKFDLYTANGDDLKERLDQGLLDLALLIEPIEATKYNYFVLQIKDTWGIITRKDDEIAKKKAITASDLYKLPLTFVTRNLVRNDLADVLKLDINRLNILLNCNLPGNALQLVKMKGYYMLGLKGVMEMSDDPELAFVPIKPKKEIGHLIVWRKNSLVSPATERFIQLINDSVQ